jgi:hypothetical protein
MRRTRLLLLGGSRFVGRAVIEEALARGWDTPLCTGGSLVRCRARWPGCGPTGPSPASWSAGSARRPGTWRWINERLTQGWPVGSASSAKQTEVLLGTSTGVVLGASTQRRWCQPCRPTRSRGPQREPLCCDQRDTGDVSVEGPQAANTAGPQV